MDVRHRADGAFAGVARVQTVKRLIRMGGLTALTLFVSGALGCAGGQGRPETAGLPTPVARDVLRIVWETQVHDPELFASNPAECASGVVVDGRLILGSQAERVHALDVASGALLWQTAVSGAVSAPATYDPLRDQVLIPSDDGTLHALDPKTGEVRWTYKTQGACEANVAVGEDALFVATSADKVYALDPEDGSWTWEYEREKPEGFGNFWPCGTSFGGGVGADRFLRWVPGGLGGPGW